MADSDKNILISPQRGSSTDSPSITLTGDGNDPISIYALDGTVGALSFEASAGQLFSITNNLTSGSIFSVNDVSGIPSIDVNSSGTVQIAPFGGTVALGQTTVTTGTVFDVKGDVRIDGDLSITSTTLISNLNADLLDGQHGSYYTGYTDTAIANLIDSSPSTLDTLNELAAALGDDANFSTTVTNSIATKLPKSGGQMTGNITFSGSQTVDGRDVSADGTKLDGIESNATADQTAAEIRTLVGSATDSNVFTDADHSKLDGIEASATADQSAAEILTDIKTVDGSGSGLDADLLDGQEGSYYLNYNNFSNTPTIPTNNNQLTNGAGYVTANTQLSNEQVQDIVGGMVSSNTESGITVTYEDSDGTLDFSVASQTDNNFTTTLKNKLDGIESGATADQTASEILTLIKTVDGAGSGLDADTLDGVAGSSYLTTANYDTYVCHLKTNVNASVDEGVSNEFTVNFNLEEHNDSGAFSHSSGVVTVLATGWYRVYANMVYGNSVNARNTIRAYVEKNGTEIASTRTYDYDRGSLNGKFSNNKIETMLYLAANDTISIGNYAYNEDGTVTIESAECEFIVNSVSVATTTSNAATLDGISSGSFLRSDAADQKTSGTLRFNDNVILALGSGDDAEFFVDGSHCYLDLNSGISNFYIRDGTTTRFTFDDDGSFTATGNVTAYSDINLKKNIEVIPNALDKVMQLRGVTFDRKDIETSRQSGVIAQEVEKVLPEVVDTNEEGIKSVAYGNLVGLLIEAIKEQQISINNLESRLGL